MRKIAFLTLILSVLSSEMAALKPNCHINKQHKISRILTRSCQNDRAKIVRKILKKKPLNNPQILEYAAKTIIKMADFAKNEGNFTLQQAVQQQPVLRQQSLQQLIFEQPNFFAVPDIQYVTEGEKMAEQLQQKSRNPYVVEPDFYCPYRNNMCFPAIKGHIKDRFFQPKRKNCNIGNSIEAHYALSIEVENALNREQLIFQMRMEQIAQKILQLPNADIDHDIIVFVGGEIAIRIAPDIKKHIEKWKTQCLLQLINQMIEKEITLDKALKRSIGIAHEIEKLIEGHIKERVEIHITENIKLRMESMLADQRVQQIIERTAGYISQEIARVIGEQIKLDMIEQVTPKNSYVTP